MEGSIECFDTLICSGAGRLTGYQRRLFMAEVATELCEGSARQAERRLGWGREDGLYSSPHECARRVMERTGTDPAQLLSALAGYDEAIAAQAAGLCRNAGRDVRDPEFTRALKIAGESVQLGFAACQKTLTGEDRHRP